MAAPPPTPSGGAVPPATTTSFKESLELGIPLSSKGVGHAASMPRGQSCLACRRRKVKCDGVRPVCGACTKSAKAHSEDPTSFSCAYDDVEKPPNKRKRAAASNSAPRSPAATIIVDHSPLASGSGSGSSSGAAAHSEREKRLEAKLAELEVKLALATSNATTSTSTSNDASFDYLLQASNIDPPFTAAPLLESSTDHLFLALLYPGWPADLPNPALVNRLLDVFFTKSHVGTDMINRSRFMASMALPPTHTNFPHRSLIHAILASTAIMVSEDFFESDPGYWRRSPDGQLFDTPADYHAKRAKIAVDEAVASGASLFHVQQAMVLLCYYWYTSARFVEVWLGCGLATRLTGPLGLNHLRTKEQREHEEAQQAMGNYVHRKAGLLGAPANDDELYERSVTFWFALLADRFASASSGWPVSMDEDDISSLLPCPNPDVDPGDLETSPLSIKSPNFFTHHPPHLVDSLGLYLKSIILLGRVVIFLQRKGIPTRNSLHKIDLRQTEEFKQLDKDALQFRLSIPKEYQPSNASTSSSFWSLFNSDNRSQIINSMPHVSTILLHEPFVSMQENDPSFAKSIVSARAILESVYNLWSTSFEIGFLAPFINLAWSVAGRTLVRDIAIRLHRDPKANISQLRTDVEVILAAMRAFRTPLGSSVAHALQTLLENPNLALPKLQTIDTCMPLDTLHKLQANAGIPLTNFGGHTNPYPSAHLSPVSSSNSPTNITSSSSTSNFTSSNATTTTTTTTTNHSNGPSPTSLNQDFPTTPNPSSNSNIVGNLFGEFTGEHFHANERSKGMPEGLNRFSNVVGGLDSTFGSGWK